jgi:hypothetical protein
MRLAMKCNVKFVGYNLTVSHRRSCSDDSVAITVKMKAKDNFRMAAML